MRKFMTRVLSVVLATIMTLSVTVSAGFAEAFAADSGTSDSDMVISLEWEDSEFKAGETFNLYEDSNTSNVVRLKCSYNCKQVNPDGYLPGELIITVKGIGAVNRSGKIEAMVGADRNDASVKTRDWTYTWNKANDTYTLTNNEGIRPNSVLSGYFELVYNINARESIHGYSQDGIQATVYLPDGSSVESKRLSFTNETKTDSFGVSISQGIMYSYEGLTAGIENPDDYAYVRYDLGTSETLRSRGLSNSTYIFDPDVEGIGTGAIVIGSSISCTSVGDGLYRVNLYSYVSPRYQYVFVAYPKSEYEENAVTAGIAKYGTYYEGDDTGNTSEQLLAENYVSLSIFADFSFGDMPGDIYKFYKDTYYDRYVSFSTILARGGDLAGYKMISGTTETFYLEFEYNHPTAPDSSFEITDDFLYILKNNGEYRQLESGEYEFTEVTIPGTSALLNTNNVNVEADVYPVSIYAFQNGEMPTSIEGREPAFSGLLRSSPQDVILPENTTAIVVSLQNLGESVNRLSMPVSVKFHIHDTSGLEEPEQDNLTSGKVVNTSFIKVYSKDGAWINNDFTESSYIDPTNLGLAQKDLNIYGNYLDRERDEITFYDSDKNDYSAYTDIGMIQSDGNRFTTTFTMGANFDFLEENYPNQFSLYTILPATLSLKDYTVPEDLWEIMSLSGLGLSSEELATACTAEIDTNYQNCGRTYLALHFDFGDREISQSSSIRAAFPIKIKADYYKKTSSSISVRSCVIIDNPDVVVKNKSQDTGSWGDDTALFSDIDRNGETTEQLASSYDYTSYIYADSSQLAVVKYVETTYTDGKESSSATVPYEEFGGNYRYYLNVKNGNNTSDHIVIQDFLETGANTEWQGSLIGVDLSEAEALGLSGTVYYSDSTTPGALDGGNWSTTMGENTRAIAVDFGDSTLKEGQEFSVNFDTSSVTKYMSYMFSDCSGLTSLDVSGFDTSKVTSMGHMFYRCSSLDSLDVSNFDTSMVTGMSYMFYGCSGPTSLDVSNFDTSKVTDMSCMFCGCSGLTALDVSNFDTSLVTKMDGMFSHCKNLTSLDVTSFDTSKVTRMGDDSYGMFSGCSSLTSLDLCSFDTSSVIYMTRMFDGCSNLQTIYVSDKWSTAATTKNSIFVFSDCLMLSGAISYDSSKTNVAYANYETGYLTYKTTIITLTVENQCPDILSVVLPDGSLISDGVTSIERRSTLPIMPTDNITFYSFEVNGEEIIGTTFTAPLESGTITISNPQYWTFVCPDTITFEQPSIGVPGVTEIQLVPLDENKIISSFELNGMVVEGSSFVLPEEFGTVTITNVVLVDQVIIESEHNPYPNSVSSVVYGEATFDGATSLTVVLDYQTESTSYDWIYLYNESGSIVNNKKYGGSTRKTETITVSGSYVKIVFKTDSSGNNYYGFKATITPIYT